MGGRGASLGGGKRRTTDAEIVNELANEAEQPRTEPVRTEPDSGPTLWEQIVAAVQRLVGRPGGWVSLTRLRAELAHLPREQVDAALLQMVLEPGVRLNPEFNQKTLTPEDRAAAVRTGGEDVHLISIEDGYELPADKVSPAAGSANEIARDQATPPEQVPAGSPEPAVPEPPRPGPATPPKAPAPPVSGAVSGAPLEKNGWDDMDFDAPLAYHDDGPIGSALRGMGAEQRMDVDGQPLANVLGRVATDVVRGERTPQEGVDAVKEVRDRLPAGSRARAALGHAISKMDGPPGPAPSVPDQTPEPMRQLVEELHKIPLVRGDPATELSPLVDLCQQAASGQIPIGLVDDHVQRLANNRHESLGDSGKFAIDRAIQTAVQALRDQRRRR